MSNRTESRFSIAIKRQGGMIAGPLIVICLFDPTPSLAQTITGTVREAADVRLISGSFVSLLDADGELIANDFTSAAGTFSLSTRAPGTYRVVVKQIGYETWESAPIPLDGGAGANLQVDLLPKPILLKTLDVSVVQSCFDDPSDGAQLSAVWEDARLALETSEWLEQQDQLTFSLTEYERTLDPRSLVVLEERTRLRERVRLPPFKSLSPEDLAASGYARVNGDTAVYHAPDAAALLSKSFQDTHCFGLTRGLVNERPVVGITFSPRRSGRAIDIEGTMWLDEETAELRTVELAYHRLPLPRLADRRQVGAMLTFSRLPDGPFYVREWWIRFPIVADVIRTNAPITGDQQPTTLVAYQEQGGTVTDALYHGASVLEVTDPALEGFVFDEASRVPLSGAELRLRDWSAAARFLPVETSPGPRVSAVTDSAGAFAFRGLPDGVFAIRVTHRLLDAAGVQLERKVIVTDGRAPPMDFALPSERDLYERLCPSSRSDRGLGAVVGFARSESTGAGVAGAKLVGARIEDFAAAELTPGENVLTPQAPVIETTADEVGRFVLCDVSVGEALFIALEGSETGVAVEPGRRIIWQDVPVKP